MRMAFTQSLAFLSVALLALPPSACCMLGPASCCSRAKKEAAPARACCQQRALATSRSLAIARCSHTIQPQQDRTDSSGQICCCVKTAVPPTQVVSSPHDVSLNALEVPNQHSILSTNESLTLVSAWVDISPARHARLCVWRC